MKIYRGFLFAAAGLTLAFGLLQAVAGEYRFGLSGVLLGGGLLLMATWAWPMASPARNWVCLGIVAASFVVLGAWLEALVVLLVLFVLSVTSGRFMLRGMSRREIERVGPEAVMPKAKLLVAEFEAEGFRRVGGLRMRIPLFRKLITSTVLAGPTDDRWAVATDRVWEVVSRFGDRWLATTSSGITPNLPAVLRQAITEARPAELVRAHQSAIEILAGKGLEADRLAEDEVVDAAQALEEHAIEAMSTVSTRRVAAMEAKRGSEDPVLGDDDRSRLRVEAWLEPQAEPG